MVYERFFGIVVFAETFAAAVVIVGYGFARPIVVAFYAEMVVGFHGEAAFPDPAFQNSLREGDTGGNAVIHHFANGNITVCVDIVGV